MLIVLHVSVCVFRMLVHFEEHVYFMLSFSGIDKVVDSIESIPKVEWDFEGIHYFDNGPLTVQYLLVLDALNFCFWPGTLFRLCFCIYTKRQIM